MPVKDKVDNGNEAAAEPAGTDFSTVPGHHVMVDGNHVGTYNTAEDAQAFIDGHLTPQNISATIVEGSEA